MARQRRHLDGHYAARTTGNSALRASRSSRGTRAGATVSARKKSVEIDRLLPRRNRRTHRVPELQALVYHRAIAERLDDQIVDDARRRLRRWSRSGRIDPRWSDEWDRILAMPLPEIQSAISADSKRARELRQTSPFAGILTEQERRRLVKAVEERSA